MVFQYSCSTNSGNFKKNKVDLLNEILILKAYAEYAYIKTLKMPKCTKKVCNIIISMLHMGH